MSSNHKFKPSSIASKGIPGKRGPKPGTLSSKVKDRLAHFTQGRTLEPNEVGNVFEMANNIIINQVAILNIRSQAQMLSLPEANTLKAFISTYLMVESKNDNNNDEEQVTNESVKSALKKILEQEPNEQTTDAIETADTE